MLGARTVVGLEQEWSEKGLEGDDLTWISSPEAGRKERETWSEDGRWQAWSASEDRRSAEEQASKKSAWRRMSGGEDGDARRKLRKKSRC